jgi:hypothetical protein
MARFVSGDLDDLLVETREDFPIRWRDFCNTYRRLLNDAEKGNISRLDAIKNFREAYAFVELHPGALRPEFMYDYRIALQTTLEEAIEDSPVKLRRTTMPPQRKKAGVLDAVVICGAFALGANGQYISDCLQQIPAEQWAQIGKGAAEICAGAGGAMLAAHAMNKLAGKKQPSEPWHAKYLHAAREAVSGAVSYLRPRAIAGVVAITALLGTFASNHPEYCKPLLKAHNTVRLVEQYQR